MTLVTVHGASIIKNGRLRSADVSRLHFVSASIHKAFYTLYLPPRSPYHCFVDRGGGLPFHFLYASRSGVASLSFSPKYTSFSFVFRFDRKHFLTTSAVRVCTYASEHTCACIVTSLFHTHAHITTTIERVSLYLSLSLDGFDGKLDALIFFLFWFLCYLTLLMEGDWSVFAAWLLNCIFIKKNLFQFWYFFCLKMNFQFRCTYVMDGFIQSVIKGKSVFIKWRNHSLI